jgi:hypothetical protein
MLLHGLTWKGRAVRTNTAVFERQGGVIGRIPTSAMYLPDEDEMLVQPIHAKIEVEHDDYWIEAVDGELSINGTRISQRTKLAHDDTLVIGRFTLGVEIVSYDVLRSALMDGLGLDRAAVAVPLGAQLMRHVGALIREYTEQTQLLTRTIEKASELVELRAPQLSNGNVFQDMEDLNASLSALLDILTRPSKERLKDIEEALKEAARYALKLSKASSAGIDQLHRLSKQVATDGNRAAIERIQSFLDPHNYNQRIFRPLYEENPEAIEVNEREDS